MVRFPHIFRLNKLLCVYFKTPTVELKLRFLRRVCRAAARRARRHPSHPCEWQAQVLAAGPPIRSSSHALLHLPCAPVLTPVAPLCHFTCRHARSWKNKWRRGPSGVVWRLCRCSRSHFSKNALRWFQRVKPGGRVHVHTPKPLRLWCSVCGRVQPTGRTDWKHVCGHTCSVQADIRPALTR